MILSAAAIALFSGCSQPSTPLFTNSSGDINYYLVPADNENPYSKNVAILHNGGLDYLGARLNSTWTGNSSYYVALEDTVENFLRDSGVEISGITFSAMSDSIMTFTDHHTMLQSDSIALAHDSISTGEKFYLDQIAKLFDSVDVYDSSTFIGRVIQCEADINSDTLSSAEQCYVLTVAAVGKSSFYYWSAQLGNPSSPWNSYIHRAHSKQAQPLMSAFMKGMINADLAGAGASLATNIGAAIVVACTGVGAVPAFTAGAADALASGLASSAWYAVFH